MQHKGMVVRNRLALLCCASHNVDGTLRPGHAAARAFMCFLLMCLLLLRRHTASRMIGRRTCAHTSQRRRRQHDAAINTAAFAARDGLASSRFTEQHGTLAAEVGFCRTMFDCQLAAAKLLQSIRHG